MSLSHEKNSELDIFPLFSAYRIRESPYLFPCFLATRVPVYFRLCGKFSGVFLVLVLHKNTFSGDFRIIFEALPRHGIVKASTKIG